jgi:hypothetical protein
MSLATGTGAHMSNSPDTDFDLELHFLPAWAQKAPDQNRYAKYTGDDRPTDDRQRYRRERPARGRDKSAAPRPPPGFRPHPSRREDRGFAADKARREPPPAAPLPEFNVAFLPEDKGVDSIARQIKITGRAYPLFDIAQMILQKPERHSVTLSIRKKPDGQAVQPMFDCALDDTLWLAEDDAVRHVLDKHFATFYQPERTQINAPKGTYTFVAQCGLSGVVLGPPNYHGYQDQLRKLHAERFARMPFDAFKQRVKIVRDEAVVKQWLEAQSWKTEYLCLNLPEPLKLGSREEVEKHFRATHLANIIKPVESFHLGGTASRNLRSPALARLMRHAWEEQKRFPLQLATVLSQKFAAHGLHFFKVNKSFTHVAVARPHYLDLDAVPVSEGVKRIVTFINHKQKCTRRHLLEALAPAAPAAGVEGAAAEAESSPEATAIIGDLHWLIHQGHVIEFANGHLETAKKPVAKPPKAAPGPPAGSPPAPSAAAPELGVEPASSPAAREPFTPPVSSVTAATAPSAAADAAAQPPASDHAGGQAPGQPGGG